MQKDKRYSALIIDDDWHNRDLFRMSLEKAGYDVNDVEDGETGLAQLAEQSFDLLILDLQMPGMDGTEVLRKLQTKFESMTVMVVTANSHMAMGEVESLADHVMYKPIDIMAFTRFVERLKNTFANRS